MSSSQDFPAIDYDKAPEKSNFALTCNRLSLYLKEKGSLGDLGLEIAGKLQTRGGSEKPQLTTTARNLFRPNMEKPGAMSVQYELMNLFPQQAEVGCPSTMIELDNTANNSSKPATGETEPKTAQMSIFYGGQVLVFDNFPANKAGELMLFAGRESCPSFGSFLSTSTAGAENIKNSSESVGTYLPNHPHLQPQPQAIASDLPIATRASLHRFFDKRKYRVAARAPYQSHGGASTSSPKRGEQLDLEL